MVYYVKKKEVIKYYNMLRADALAKADAAAAKKQSKRPASFLKGKPADKSKPVTYNGF